MLHFVTKNNGNLEPFDLSKIQKAAAFMCEGLNVSQSELELNVKEKFFDKMKTAALQDALITSAGELISREQPDYKFAAARGLLQKVYKEVTGGPVTYPSLRSYIEKAIAEKQVDPRLAMFDLDALDAVIDQKRDLQFDYLGLQTVADRYLLRTFAGVDGIGDIIELPQHFFMRVAMGLAMRDAVVDGALFTSAEVTKDAIEFYDVLSSFDFMSSTPTLFNSGTNHPQMSSCYLNKVKDALYSDETDEVGRFASIYGTIEECARLSKYAGGIGTDWHPVRPAGSLIRGTNGRSAGTVPYIKVYNDTAIAVNQGGKRNGAFAPYMEPWHPDFLDFIDLKKNSGDERRRAHETFPAAWVPSLFMERVKSKGMWSFFASDEFPELHELWGAKFEKRYRELEDQGKYRFQMPALDLWKKWLGSMFETGHPWITFKDEMNRRSPQQHVGVIHHSNLCTEIALNTSDEETAVCNLGSVNLARHIKDGKLNIEKLRRTVRVAARMLDNVVDINFYPSKRAELANLRHRPVGMGVMGLIDALTMMGVDWESQACLDAQNEMFAAWSYFTIDASADLARERGSYSTFEGSLWSNGILPIMTANAEAMGLTPKSNRVVERMFDWSALAEKVRGGMRNSNTMAVAPTATIANICGVGEGIQLPFKLEYTKSNLAGSFQVVPACLQYGDVKDAFSVQPTWTVKGAAVRQKWIDQAQSLNIYVAADIRGSELSDIYMEAHELGVKTTYYLKRQVRDVKDVLANQTGTTAPAVKSIPESPAMNLCSLDDVTCESCQ